MTSKDARILVVDDDREFAESMAEHMVELGCSVKVAYDGHEGLNKFSSDDFHLVFTDLQMPVMDGMELLREIKALDKRSVVVIITGFGTIKSAVQAIKEGAYDYVTKPLKLDELDIVIDRALEKRTLVKQLDFFRGLTLAALISIPIWLALGIILASIIF
ncbi:MAG: response regulator [Desulfobacterales bacterium]|nr:response regulator [Desulfobacterales bacterium]